MKITDRIVYRLSLIFVLVFAAVMILGYLDVAQGQAVASEGETASSMIDDFMKRDNTDKIIVALIFLSPGIMGVLLNILYVRIKRAIFLEQHKEAMPASLGHMLALKAGAVFGALCLVGMQGIVNFIFEFPFVPVIVIGQFVMAIIATGLISILAYEVIRFLLAWRYRSTGKPVYRAVFNWLSVKVDKQGKPASSTTQLFSMKDKTVMSE